MSGILLYRFELSGQLKLRLIDGSESGQLPDNGITNLICFVRVYCCDRLFKGPTDQPLLATYLLVHPVDTCHPQSLWLAGLLVRLPGQPWRKICLSTFLV